MKLSSFHSLREEIESSVLAPHIHASIAAASQPRHRANEPEDASPIAGDLSIGLARKNKNSDSFLVALRYSVLTPGVSQMIDKIRSLAHGETDVQETGELTTLARPWHQSKRRPLEPGISVGHVEVTAGTLGVFVVDRDDEVCILSNAHVLSNVNRGRLGDPILQPGKADDGVSPRDVVASLSQSSRILFKPGRTNLIDAALAKLNAGLVHQVVHRDIGNVSGIFEDMEELVGTKVKKGGRTTGRTTGIVTATGLKRLGVSMEPSRSAYFDQVVEIQAFDATGPFSRGGDSGSLIVTESGLACGLLFAGGSIGGRHGLGRTLANPISLVLDAMDCRLLGLP